MHNASSPKNQCLVSALPELIYKDRLPGTNTKKLLIRNQDIISAILGGGGLQDLSGKFSPYQSPRDLLFELQKAYLSALEQVFHRDLTATGSRLAEPGNPSSSQWCTCNIHVSVSRFTILSGLLSSFYVQEVVSISLSILYILRWKRLLGPTVYSYFYSNFRNSNIYMNIKSFHVIEEYFRLITHKRHCQNGGYRCNFRF